MRDTQRPEYRTWVSIKTRCYNEKSNRYPFYGAKGVKMADEWLNDFPAFFAHVEPKPFPKATIDRIDTTGNYVPGNVRWIPQSEQLLNRGGFNVRIEYKGENKCLSEWSKQFDIPRDIIKLRIAQGWSLDKVFLTPYEKRLIAKVVIDTYTLKEWKSVNAAAKANGIPQPQLWAMLRGDIFNTTNLMYKEDYLRGNNQLPLL